MEEENILFVCTGNTCRSPMAEGILRLLLSESGRVGSAASAGLAANEGEPASACAIRAAAELGIDLAAHRARNVTRPTVAQSGLIFAMTPRHEQALISAFPECAGRVEVLGGGIPDPFGGGIEEYRFCRDRILVALRDRLALAPRQGGGFEIIRMQAQHLDALARLEAMCFSKPWSRDSLASELENPVAVFFVAQADGAAVGYAGMHHVVDEGYIDNIAVHPLYRRRGAANALLARLDRYAVKNGLAFLTLEVRRSNKEAQRLYARNGFVKAGERRDFYVAPPEDAVIMTKYYADTPDGERIGSQTNE